DEVAQLIGEGSFQTWITRISLTAGGIAGFGYVVLMLLTVANVTGRITSGHGILASVDIIELTMPGLIFLAMSTAELSGSHVRTPLLTNRIPGQLAIVFRALAQSISSGYIAWLLWATLLKAIESAQTNENRFALMNIPVWPARIAMVVGLALFLIVLIAQATR